MWLNREPNVRAERLALSQRGGFLIIRSKMNKPRRIQLWLLRGLEALELEFLKLRTTRVPFCGQCLSSWETLRLLAARESAQTGHFLLLTQIDLEWPSQVQLWLSWIREWEEMGKGAEAEFCEEVWLNKLLAFSLWWAPMSWRCFLLKLTNVTLFPSSFSPVLWLLLPRFWAWQETQNGSHVSGRWWLQAFTGLCLCNFKLLPFI